jgi:hypothetical protein
MIMNEVAAAISSDYIQKFRTGLNQYIMVSERRPYESLDRFRDMLWRLGMLVEIWAHIEAQQKERKHG